jgi:type IV pilus assembly protein PilA
MKNLQRGFTLIELMIVVAIIGILAAVAVPAYQDYIARAQVSEAVYLLQSGKTGLAEYYGDKTTWPSAASEVVGNTSGKYTSGIALLPGSSTTGSVTLEATMKTSGINSAITSGTALLYTLDGGKTWECRTGVSSRPLAAKYLPSVCR